MKAFYLIALVICSWTIINAQKMTEKHKNKISVKYLNNDFSINDLDNKFWAKAVDISIENYWSGKIAPVGRHFKAKFLWSDTALYVRFEAKQAEPLIISDTPNLTGKTDGLWNRDVCEIFIAPNVKEFRKYFEFEAAPTGEWVDLKIYQMPEKRETDLEYNSGMKTAAKIEKDKVWIAVKIEWKAFNKTPKPGDIWLGNIFRCIGSGEDRGYLAWQATKTKSPNFHVPTKFGKFEFTK